MNTYPKEFKNQVYMVAYGVEGLTDHVDPEVYDAHEAFEIDKTKMKMLVPLDMNGKQLMNVNYDLKFSDLFKFVKCYFRKDRRQKGGKHLLYKNSDNQILSYTTPMVLQGMKIYSRIMFDETFIFYGNSNNNDLVTRIKIRNFPTKYFHNDITYMTMLFLFDTGINRIELDKFAGVNMDVDLILSHK